MLHRKSLRGVLVAVLTAVFATGLVFGQRTGFSREEFERRRTALMERLGGVLKEGMVFAIEPGLYYPEKGFGLRIEDTVLITREGCEVLTSGVPKEIEEIETLLAGRDQKPRE
jgi:Xaa-Pro aminopeptidase